LITKVATFTRRDKASPTVFPFAKEGKKAFTQITLPSGAKRPLECGDFTGKVGEIALCYDGDERIILLGVGDGDVPSYHKAFAALTSMCRKREWTEINIVTPSKKFIASAEGILFANYAFDHLKKEKETLIKSITWLGATAPVKKEIVKVFQVGEGVNLARDLTNGNADDVTPQHLGKIAQDLMRSYDKVETKLLKKKEIEKEKMGLFLAVSRGSACDPLLIVCHYNGAPSSKERTVVVGKGVTYDTGGLNIKPTGSMETMKCDMGGSATALGVIKAAASSNIKANITAVVAATENAVGSKSYKPGDVYTAMNGLTVEITNTDAEGRLTLADALYYAATKIKPTRMIDFATLTGAIEIALGPVRSGLFSTDSKLEKALMKAGDATEEKLWPFPLDPAYREMLNSDIADLVNAKRRSAGSITAASFLKEFTDGVSWAHIDIASTAYLSKKFYGTTPATGVGVRMILEFLRG